MNTAKLRGKITENNMTLSAFADAIGIDKSTLNRKLHADGLKFTVGEIYATIDVLNLTKTEAADIFLPNNSQKCEN